VLGSSPRAEVRWRSAGIDDPARPLDLPFFIAWDPTSGGHPGLAQPPHRVPAVGIERVDVVGSADELRRWLGGADLPIVTSGEAGEPGIRTVTVALADGGSLVVER
jgi:hypothetical protein